MRHRFFAVIRVPAALVAVIVVVWAARGSVAGQSPTPKAQTTASTKKFTTPRTSWGEPDRQGVWSYANLTPLERPSSQAGKESLDVEEVAELNKEARTGADRRDGGADADLARAYNAFWYDRGKSDGRTSLIVEPADG